MCANCQSLFSFILKKKKLSSSPKIQKRRRDQIEMVAVFNKELLSWYLITLKLNQAVETGLQNAQSPTNLTPLDFPGKKGDEAAAAESEWVVAIKEKLEQARADDGACAWGKLSIYRIPQSLRVGGDDKAYIPQTVSLGPYHHGRKRLRGMDRHKWRALHRVLERTGHRVELYLDAVREVEERARACYEGPLGLPSKDFVEMLVLDAVFALELFQGAAAGFAALGYSRNDPVFAMRGAMHSIQRDMIMLENQIPLFVLDRLHAIQCPAATADRGAVARLALRFFDPLMPTDEPPPPQTRGGGRPAVFFDPLTDQGGLHCLEVFRRSLLLVRTGPNKPAPRVWIKRWSHAGRVADRRRQQLIHCVTELKEAGIKFKRKKTDRFWDIDFDSSRGVLHVPQLLVHDGTKSLFLNLIAFEQRHLECTNDVTSYVIFMDNLIDSPADVSYLHYCGIIENWLGSDAEVADLFNRLCREVVFDINDSSLSRLSEKVNRYYDHRWNAWRASLTHKYFNNPWSIISFLAALVLLVLTLAQTFYTVYAYYAPTS
ncbi:UPF0481 protein At3g47200-like [Salvia miltiorrhiza]|uniref:UPF0481 protein At3g47200-like n=1 Tax=Salvia miltiorrhiza TaxID=226208 RepID=UPI0025AC0761|nr:UPF0481 protein At3g47200-like [Salvia miltiorrhiza]